MFYVLFMWLAPVHRRWTFVGVCVYKKAGVLGVCTVLYVIAELVFCNVRAHRVLRASLWLTPCPPKVDVCWVCVYNKADVLGVCSVL